MANTGTGIEHASTMEQVKSVHRVPATIYRVDIVRTIWTKDKTWTQLLKFALSFKQLDKINDDRRRIMSKICSVVEPEPEPQEP